MKKIFDFLRKITPKPILYLYHYFLAFVFAVLNGFPSKKIVVIGITGTKGKSTVTYLVYYLLKNLGIKAALSSSEFFFIDDKKIENKSRLTMPGRGFLQKFLKQAVENKCEVAVLEVTSEGLAQSRHAFIDFDIAVFLNLHPEHIEHHGSYEAYRNAKGKLFKALEKSKVRKFLRGTKVKKTIIVNIDDFEADYFLSFRAEQKINFSLESSLAEYSLLKPTTYKIYNKGIEFVLEGKKFSSPLLGKINLYNLLAGLSVIKALSLPINSLEQIIKEFKGLPGRFDIINAKGFKVIVDYAHTPDSIEEVYKTVIELFKPKRMICLIGSAGGLRDKWKRPVIGEIAAKYCNHIVISDEDPFNEDPNEIIKAIEMGAKRYLAEFEIEKPIEIIPDRKRAIFRLIELAQKGDIVITIGKGNEPSIVYKDKTISWNEKEVVIEALKNYSKISTKTL
ncbi:MAG: UDP-N-acetylmuramyl-tripeptide synthetase [Candidatus Parcubacteria bacterium]|nr:MAG: UDP-N-acetylmuramyl-tripeptide synthetase [Candidatus Parcubacteria bacterium]